MNPNSVIQIVLFLAAIAILFVASVAIVRFGKELRGQVTPPTERIGRQVNRPSPGNGLSRETYAIARKLKDQGLAPGALAAMSAAEQKFFLDTMSAKLGDGTGPRLVRPPAGGAAAAAAAAAAPATVDAAPIPAAALVTGPIHCPVCRTVIGKRSEAGPTMQKCPGCGRRVTTKVDGDRLVVSVSYGLGTPRSSGAIKAR